LLIKPFDLPRKKGQSNVDLLGKKKIEKMQDMITNIFFIIPTKQNTFFTGDM